MTTLRDARIEDASDICAITKAWSELPGHLVTEPHEVSAERIAFDIPAIQRTGRCLVADGENGVVGFALLKPMELDAIAHVFRLTIAVHPSHAGRGIGAVLLERLLEWTRAAPAVLKVELLVRSSNQRAIRLYQKFGFTEEGRFKNRVRTRNGTFIDDVSTALFPEKLV